jgi:hypothetical protein
VKPSEAVIAIILAVAILAAAVPSHGQQPGKVYRISFLSGNLFAPTEDTHR